MEVEVGGLGVGEGEDETHRSTGGTRVGLHVSGKEQQVQEDSRHNQELIGEAGQHGGGGRVGGDRRAEDRN